MNIRPYLNTTWHMLSESFGSVVLLEFSISTCCTKSTNFTTIQLLLAFFVIVESMNWIFCYDHRLELQLS